MRVLRFALSAGLLASGIAAQAQVKIYGGIPVKETGIQLGSWGSGEARETEEKSFNGSRSLKIVTHGRFQGARIILPSPIDLKSVQDDKTAYLQFQVSLPAKGASGMGADYGGMMRGMSGMMRGGKMAAGGGPGGSGGIGRGGKGGAPGGEGGLGGGTTEKMLKPRPLENLRIVLVTTDHHRVEANLPLSTAIHSREDWTAFAVPVTSLSGLKDSNGQVSEVMIFGDSPATMYLGEARITRDETPIRVDDLPEMTVAANEKVTFSASAEGGVSPLLYEWDFDESDGVAVDAEGRSVKHAFPKARKLNMDTIPYTVTLTVRDPYGLKAPAVKKMKVYVTL